MKNIKGQSLLFTISKKDPFYFFDYKIVIGKGVTITKLYKLTEKGVKSVETNIKLPLQVDVRYETMRQKLEKDPSFTQELQNRKAVYFEKLIKLCEAENFDYYELLTLITDTDLYANVSKMYEEMIKRIERKDLD